MPFVSYLVDGTQLDYELSVSGESVLFVCAVCGEVWARVHYPNSDRWLIEEAPCREHHTTGVSDILRVSGSILPIQSRWAFPGLSPTFLDNLPPELVRREFQVHLAYFERKNHGNEEESSAACEVNPTREELERAA